MNRSLKILTMSAMLLGCDSTGLEGLGSAAQAAPIKCPVGYTRKGNRCIKNPVTPPPTKTCWDGSVILATLPCPVEPPPTQTCWDGTVISILEECPPIPQPDKECPDGSMIPILETCPPIPEPVTWRVRPLMDARFAQVVPAGCLSSSYHKVAEPYDYQRIPLAGNSIWNIDPVEFYEPPRYTYNGIDSAGFTKIWVIFALGETPTLNTTFYYVPEGCLIGLEKAP